jgi:signal transduction histidine kinase
MLLVFAYMAKTRQLKRRMKRRLAEVHAERERIARDLHDSFFQGIQGVMMLVGAGAAQLRQDDPAHGLLDRALDRSDKVMQEGREIVSDLRSGAGGRPPLPAALSLIGKEMAALHGIDFQVDVHGEPRALSPVIGAEFYRIGKEALTNAFNHAAARKISVQVIYALEEFSMVVEDDGAGMEAVLMNGGSRSGHWGLPGMRERASKSGATLEIIAPGQAGTRLSVRIAAELAYASVRTAKWSIRELWSRRADA